MATANQPTYYEDATVKAAREAEVPEADWDGGLNKGASNAPILGVATGVLNPSPENLSAPDPVGYNQSQSLGLTVNDITYVDPVMGDTTGGFVEASGAVAPDAVITTESGNDYLNRTGETMADGDRAFGIVDNS